MQYFGALDSMGFVHALLLVNITFVPYRPDIGTVSGGCSTYTWLAGHNNNSTEAEALNGWIVDNEADEEGLFLTLPISPLSLRPSWYLLMMTLLLPAVTPNIDQCLSRLLLCNTDKVAKSDCADI